MTIVPMAHGHSWQARICYIAAALFTLASGGTNLIYGWSKGTDIASSLVWAAVSVGVSIIFALSWPALIYSLDRKQWARALMVFGALVITGTYSVSAALGSAAGGRMNAAATETATTGARQRAQAAYDQARAALAQLAPSRTEGEIDAALATARPTCRNTTLNGRRELFCVLNAALTAERARTQRHRELQDQIDRASAALREAPAHVANTDAKALQRYLGAVGFKVGADRLNDLLTLLAVLVIETAGGLALVMALALSEKSLSNQSVHTAPAHGNGQRIKETPAGSKELGGALTVHSPAHSTRDRLLAMVRDANGALRTGHRALGVALGVSIVVSLVKRGFAIELRGLPLAIYEQYAWMRDMLFWPVVWVLSWLNWSIPVWIKDLLMAYGLMSAAVGRWAAKAGARIEIAGPTWPILLMFDLSYVIYRNPIESAARRGERWQRLTAIAREVATVCVFAIAFFLWNHLQNVFGPITN
jgi:hypothetical protein